MTVSEGSGKKRGPLEPNKWTMLAMKHPVQLALGSAVVLGIWTAVLVMDRRAVAATMLVTFVLVYLLWMPGKGPARRRTERLFPWLAERPTDQS